MRKTECVGFIIKPHAPDIINILKEIIPYFDKKGIKVLLEEFAAQKLGEKNGIPRENIPEETDLVIVFGGDGTLLSIAHIAAQKKVPVLGVNLGRLGFLTEVPLNEFYITIEAYLKGEKKILSPRQLIKARIKGKTFHCLNDIVINKGALARMIQFRVWLDNKDIATLRADGLIIATPTGSTAYSLSAGGPIVYPYIPAIIIAPICPHTLTFRPMVISLNSLIRIQLLTGGEEVYLTLDGQRGGELIKNDIIEVQKSPLQLELVSSPKRNYVDLLHEKLNWG
ncbi:MAG: NAD(+)/NADH kinase [Candidatus Aminicenantaceae bacterium]